MKHSKTGLTTQFRHLVGALAFLALFQPFSSRAYVTSAVLEYMGDDKCGFYLNGRQLLSASESDIMYFWFGALSTSDGTLPLELFNNNGDNLLAAVNKDLFGGSMYMAYRLTVHHSNGDPVKVWGEPDKTKFFNVPRNVPFPAGWYLPNFNDASWGPAVKMTAGYSQGVLHLHLLEDANFSGFFGQRGYVPFLCHNSNGNTNPGAADLYRSHFSFPNAVGKATLVMNPEKAYTGQQVAFRLIPSRDAADFSTYRAFVKLPANIKPTQILNNGKFDAAQRMITWTLANPADAGNYVKMTAGSVLDGGGWQLPEKVLGGYKAALRTDAQNVSQSILNDAATFFPNQAAWFKMSNPGTLEPGALSKILGVIFRGQYRLGGRDTADRKGANQIYLNYSIDGSNRAALKEDVLFTHASTDGSNSAGGTARWADGYYDATEDRPWTWNDIANLRVRIQSRMIGSKAQDYMASLRCTARVFKPNAVSPAFLAQVTERNCKKVEIQAGVEEPKSGLKAVDSYWLPVNQNACPTNTPTTVPTPMPTPRPGTTPLPTPTAVKPPVDYGLACLQNSPEPFKRGGTFIYFCLTKPANIAIKIMTVDGRLIRTLSLGSFRTGNSQVFFNALDGQGNLLAPGSYMYEITAETEEGAQTRHTQFNKVVDAQPGRGDQ